MAQKVKSDALSVVQRALGLTGTPASGDTEFLEGTLDQVIDVGPLVRRGRTLAGTGGIFRGILRNVHPGADSKSSGIAPYAALEANVVAPFPAVVPPEFDVWLLTAGVRRFTGSGALSRCFLVMTNVLQGFGINDSGAPVVGVNEIIPLAYWDDLQVSTDTIGVTTSMGPLRKLGIRIPRIGVLPAAPVGLSFRSTSAGAATFDCLLLMGLFPVGLGQDVL